MKGPRRCALSRWRRRRRYQRRLAIAELALGQAFTLPASLVIDLRVIPVEAAA